MKNIWAKVIVLISTIVIGFLIAGNFSFQGVQSSLQLSTKEYQKAVETKNTLMKQVNALSKSNEDIANKINEYNLNDGDHDKIIENMKSQVEFYGMLTGTNEVQGSGIIVTINDGIINNNDTEYSMRNKILHDIDMALVLNDIRGAGAEAIAIRNHRITPLSAVACTYAFLGFDDDDTQYAPFYVYAIGDPESLKTTLLSKGSYLNLLKNRGLLVEVELSDKIIMPARSIRNMEYMTEYINKK